jgi:hypothetical protein
MDIERDELISAYFDGELTGDQRGRAERLLAEDPEARRLWSELQSLRSSLASLPRQSLPAGFAERVLAKAESQATFFPAVPIGEMHAVAQREHARRPGLDRWPHLRRRLWRPLVYAGAAAAAALLITVYRGSDRHIASRPRREGAAPLAAPRHQRLEAFASKAQPGSRATLPEMTMRASEAAADVARLPKPEAAAAPSAPASTAHSADEVLVIEGNTASAAGAASFLDRLLVENAVHVEQHTTQTVEIADRARTASAARPPSQVNLLVTANQRQLNAILERLQDRASPVTDVAVRAERPSVLASFGLASKGDEQLNPPVWFAPRGQSAQGRAARVADNQAAQGGTANSALQARDQSAERRLLKQQARSPGDQRNMVSAGEAAEQRLRAVFILREGGSGADDTAPRAVER